MRLFTDEPRRACAHRSTFTWAGEERRELTIWDYGVTAFWAIVIGSVLAELWR